MKLIFCFWGLMVMGCFGHPCPFNWNIVFSEKKEIRGKNFEDFCLKFNEAVRLETKGRVKKAVIYTEVDSFRLDDPKGKFGEEMKRMVERYKEAMPFVPAANWKGLRDRPIEESFTANFPVACILNAYASGSGGSESEEADGLYVGGGKRFWCRAYAVNEKFLAEVAAMRKAGDDGGDLEERVFAKHAKVDIKGKEDESGQTGGDPFADEQIEGDPFIMERKVVRQAGLAADVSLYLEYLPEDGVMLVLAEPSSQVELHRKIGALGFLKKGGTLVEQQVDAATRYFDAVLGVKVEKLRALVGVPFYVGDESYEGDESFRSVAEVAEHFGRLKKEGVDKPIVEFEKVVPKEKNRFEDVYVSLRYEIKQGTRAGEKGLVYLRDGGGKWVVYGVRVMNGRRE